MGRTRRLLLVGLVILVLGAGVAVYASFHRTTAYARFRTACLDKKGSAVVTLGTTSRNFAMGGPEKLYKLGCRAPDGTIGATITTNQH
jgi:hypothetical protein